MANPVFHGRRAERYDPMVVTEKKNRPKASIVIALAHASLLTALLYLLFFHLSSDAPMRTGGNRPVGLETSENLQLKTAAEMDRASDGKNLQVHFQMPPEEWSQHAFFFTTVYYRAAYEMYPRRLYVGADNQVINFPSDLKAADQLPNIDWLRQHRVPAVFAFVPGDERGPGARVYRVP